MKSEYILRVNTNVENYDSLTEVLGITPTSTESFWELSINDESELSGNSIGYFLDLIENKRDDLNKNGIKMEEVSIWLLYEYNDQCNMEFTPKDLRRLGNNGIALCISCWQE